MFDVVVVGAGPGGSVAAKKCVQHGLRALLLERGKLPRHKICSGMIMSRLAQTLLEKEFGQIPEKVLTIPPYLSGFVLHLVGMGSRSVEHRMPIAWRKDLDYWMTQKAQDGGVELRDNAEVTDVVEVKYGYVVTFKLGREEHKIKTKYVIGADGATSVVRKGLFPDLRVQYIQVIQECYLGALDLQREYFHFFYFPEIAVAPSFDAHHKENHFIIDVMAITGELKKLNLVSRAKEVLFREHNFDPKQQPLWTKGCLQPLLYRKIVSGSFSPCKGNVLLVGEAGGLLMPLMAGDGIREAVWSGLLAANSIIKAEEAAENAEKFYLNEIVNIVSMHKTIYSWAKKIREQAAKGGEPLLETLEELWEKTLSIDSEWVVSG
jgi:flavin-dependent dehydrogenase